MAVRGGDKLKRFIREAKSRAGRAPLIQVGFVDDRIAPLAYAHEYGVGQGPGSLPERPAFRNALPAVQKAMRDELLRIAKATSPFPGYKPQHFKQVAIAGRDALRAGYLAFEGEPLSAVQTARKAGTPGAGRQLVGSRGPRMIEHIEAFVNGVRVA